MGACKSVTVQNSISQESQKVLPDAKESCRKASCEMQKVSQKEISVFPQIKREGEIRPSLETCLFAGLSFGGLKDKKALSRAEKTAQNASKANVNKFYYQSDSSSFSPIDDLLNSPSEMSEHRSLDEPLFFQLSSEGISYQVPLLKDYSESSIMKRRQIVKNKEVSISNESEKTQKVLASPSTTHSSQNHNLEDGKQFQPKPISDEDFDANFSTSSAFRILNIRHRPNRASRTFEQSSKASASLAASKSKQHQF